MAGTLLKASGTDVTKHLQILTREFLTFVPSKNVGGLHWQKKWSTYPLFLSSFHPNQRLHSRAACSLAIENQSTPKRGTVLYLDHVASYSKHCLSVQGVHSCVVNDGLRKRSSSVSFGSLHLSPPQNIQVRHKSKDRQQDVDSEAEDSDEEHELQDDDFEAPPNFKIVKLIVASTRADAVVSHALNIGRNNLEEVFLGSGLYLNGSKLLKKAVKLDEGDYADLVVERADGQLKVKRVKVLKIYPDKTAKDKSKMKVRVWKAPFFIAKPDN